MRPAPRWRSSTANLPGDAVVILDLDLALSQARFRQMQGDAPNAKPACAQGGEQECCQPVPR